MVTDNDLEEKRSKEAREGDKLYRWDWRLRPLQQEWRLSHHVCIHKGYPRGITLIGILEVDRILVPASNVLQIFWAGKDREGSSTTSPG
jgi:hypothetical protein